MEDIPAVMALMRHVTGLMRASGNAQWDDAYPSIETFREDVERGELWVAEKDGKLAGVAAITTCQEPEYADAGWDLNEPSLVVHRLAVAPEFRGLGIASSLMRQAESLAETREIAVLRVDTSTENEATQKLFPKLGYTYAGEIGLSFRPGLRVRCYEKRLS